MAGYRAALYRFGPALVDLLIHSPDGNAHQRKLLPLTSQTKLTLALTPETKLTLEHGTNPTKP